RDEVLAEHVDRAEREQVVMELAMYRILRHVAQRVVHPAHVPLEGEAEPATVSRPRHLRPCCGLLRNGHRAGALAVRDLVEALQERDRLEVLVAAELVRSPLMRAARIVQIEYGGDRVDAQTIEVEVLEPAHCAR